MNNGFKIIGNKIYLSVSKHMKEYLYLKHGINEKYLVIDVPKEIKGNLKIIEIIPKTKGYTIYMRREENKLIISYIHALKG